eukprot:CAMPEP_0184699828 /NCGR_PEP_ID=MMETSP0313-20130426/5939_1 /TAXON_ID=2792 /ORGANISM="Porphyridium aerugineum, Strain SAG 1380-2" /LENGTH=2155 /DNA_ID=CAMNT_0027158957 /DNA_START=349 /DNA_END=6816 /DNA_ORIENTATION=-
MDAIDTLHRFNAQLPASYRDKLLHEQKTQFEAIQVLCRAIRSEKISVSERMVDSSQFWMEEYESSLAIAAMSSQELDKEEHKKLKEVYSELLVQEGYECNLEQDLSSLEKGISKYMDLKYIWPVDSIAELLECLLRGVLSPGIDLGLRSKLARTCVRLLRKRCLETLPYGVPWRAMLDLLWEVHVDCAEGGPYVGRDVRDAHCRNMLSLLTKCRNFLGPNDSAERIWGELGNKIQPHNADDAFAPLLVLTHILPTRGSSWNGWVPSAMEMWKTIEFSSDWDSSWLALCARLAKHQPNVIDWTPYVSVVYERIPSSFRLPLGGAAPQNPVERRCPAQLVFLQTSKMTVCAAKFAVYALSPARPMAMEYFKKLIHLVKNFFHPSNGGKWSSYLASFLGHFTSDLVERVAIERAANEGGVKERIVGSNHVKPVPEYEHRLDKATLDELVDLLLPLVLLGLHAKSGYMTVQCAASARDLAAISPEKVVGTLLEAATEGLTSVGTPHRTSAALKMLATLTPVFLDSNLVPYGTVYLPQALELTLPGIDANDPSKTEATFRFIAGAAARLQLQTYEDVPENIGEDIARAAISEPVDLNVFLEEYTAQLLDRIFALLDALEAPPKKNKASSGASSAPTLSSFIFSVAMENLFGALPKNVIKLAAERVVQQVSGASKMNALKFYGALVRILSAASNDLVTLPLKDGDKKDATASDIKSVPSNLQAGSGAPENLETMVRSMSITTATLKPEGNSLFIPALLVQIVEIDDSPLGGVTATRLASSKPLGEATGAGGQSSSIMRTTSVSNPNTNVRLSSLSEEELVWRLRMLAQACRTCNNLIPYYEKIFDAVRLAFMHKSRTVYKAGGRLLRGLMEGLTSTRMLFGTGGEEVHSGTDGAVYNFDWWGPGEQEWEAASRLVQATLNEVEQLLFNKSLLPQNTLYPPTEGFAGFYEKHASEMSLDREKLFHALRILHAVQRGGRWLMAGAIPDVLSESEKRLKQVKSVDDEVRASKLVMLIPALGNVGGELNKDRAQYFWERIHSICLVISVNALVNRPDDGALLYRSLEPFELAHEPFRRSSQGRMTVHAARGYKAAYKPVVAIKIKFGSAGGVGRGMPRFIQKLRLEALHDMRLGVAARGGMCSETLFSKILSHLTEMSLNDFPNVRIEARGVLTRALRVAPMALRRKEISRVIQDLEDAAKVVGKDEQAGGVKGSPRSKAEVATGGPLSSPGAAATAASAKISPPAAGATAAAAGSEPAIATSAPSAAPGSARSSSEVNYEKLMGAADVLRSSAASPYIMREWSLFNMMGRSISRSMLAAERADAAIIVGSLFTKLAALARPLSLGGVVLFEDPLSSVDTFVGSTFAVQRQKASVMGTNEVWRKNRYKYDELNTFLLAEAGVQDITLDLTSKELGAELKKIQMDTHWRLQSLIATIFYIGLRSDLPPSLLVARYLCQAASSEVIALRQVALKAVALMLALSERRRRIAPEDAAAEDALVNVLCSTICESDFLKELLHKLALDQADEIASEYSEGGYGDNVFAGLSMMSLAKNIDGDACWALVGGRPWPSSWIPRSRDTFGIVRVKLFETLAFSFGRKLADSVDPMIYMLLHDAERFSGVTEDGCRVVAGEAVAGICRGLRINPDQLGVENSEAEVLMTMTTKWVDMMLDSFSGHEGMVNGGTLLRLIASSDIQNAIGKHLGTRLAKRMLSHTPLLDTVSPAHVQAKKLRYIHSLVADSSPFDADAAHVAATVSRELCSNREIFSHPLKHVREEIARCLSLFSMFRTEELRCSIEESCQMVANMLDGMSLEIEQKKAAAAQQGEPNGSRNGNGGASVSSPTKMQQPAAGSLAAATAAVISSPTSGELKKPGGDDDLKKERSRAGETLSRWVSVVHWNGDTFNFAPYLSIVLPSLFASLDDSDQERLSHAHLALSLASQAKFSTQIVDKIVIVIEHAIQSPRWRIRGSVLPFTQVLAFCRLFSVPESTLVCLRKIIESLLADEQLEVREAACHTLIPSIRDAPEEAVVASREQFISKLRSTDTVRNKTSKRRHKKEDASASALAGGSLTANKPAVDPKLLLQRHAAVLGLSALVMSQPYEIPDWMPNVLMELAKCINNPAPISASVRNLFAEFWRTHRDEWQSHKSKFNEEEREVVSELLISPSYYA